MNTATRVTTFVAGLSAMFGLALVAGNAVGPIGAPVESAHDGSAGEAAHGSSAAGGDAHGAHEASAPETRTEAEPDLPGGLMVSQNGYTLELEKSTARAGRGVPVSFGINGPDGKPVHHYDPTHEKLLHLIVVRRDLSGFQHVHPQLSADGSTWSTELDLAPGVWRLYADFKAAGTEPLTLGSDLSVAGTYRPVDPAQPSRTVQVDGYTVTLEGKLIPGADSKLTLSVSRDGRPVTDLQPYLGAYGHLVALRDGDLAYLHVHPDGAPGDGATEPGPDVIFYASVPSPGSYRLFLDFKHHGEVRTAEFPTDSRRSR